MYISELHVDGFGALQNVHCVFDAPLTVVIGPNEAGKSSLARFIRTMLYGFATRANMPERSEPVNGGRHGGRLVLLDEEGKRLVLERYADAPSRKGGAFAVLRDEIGNERRLSQSDVERLLLGGIPERLFRQLFAVTLDELHELRSLQGEEIGNYLYHAGMAGGASLSLAGKRLSADMDKLYRPKGETQALNLVLRDMKTLELELRTSRLALGHYQEVVRELEELESALNELAVQLPQKRARVIHLETALDSREWWLRAETLRREEQELQSKLPVNSQQVEPISEEIAARWHTALQKRDESFQLKVRSEEQLNHLTRQRGLLSWNEELVKAVPSLERLVLQAESAAGKRTELAVLSAERQVLEENTASLMMRLSPDLTESAIQGWMAVADRESARGFERRLADVGRLTERLEGEAQRLRRERDALAESYGRLHHSSGMREVSAHEAPSAERLFLPDNREALLQAWHVFEDAYREVESARKQANWAEADAAVLNRAGGASPSLVSVGRSRGRRASGSTRFLRYTVPVLAGAGALGSAIAAALQQGQTALPYGLLAAALAILTGASLLRIYRPVAESNNSGAGELARAAFERSRSAWAELDRRLAQASSALGRLLANPETAAASLLGAEDERTTAESEQARKSLRDAVYSYLAKEAEQDRVAAANLELRSRMEQAERESARVEQELSDSKSMLVAVRDQWKEWLTLRSLPQDLEPTSLPEFVQLAEQALQLFRQRSRLEERSAVIAGQLAAFEAEAAEWLLLHPHPLEAQADSVTALKQLYREALAQKETAAEARRQDEHIQVAEASVAAALSVLADAEAAVAEPMSAAGTTDEAAYAARIVIDARRLALRQERREAELRLEAGRDETTRQELFKLLGEHDASALSALLEIARIELARLEAEQAERLDRRGRLAQELSRLRSEAEIEDRAIALGERQAELDRLADRYTMLALTAELIRQTRSSFEEERQPDVLRLASGYFSTMTGGRYRRIMAPQDTHTLLAEDQEKRMIESAYLSRGTQEQLYLSLRLALASAASAGTSLPLLLDDLFVHFDAQRLERGIDVLEEASRVRQTIFFTCHEHIARMVKERLPDAGVIRVPL